MTEPLVLQNIDGPVATLTLNRPERRNALSPELIEVLIENLQQVKNDPQVKVVVLTGAGGKAFCAGGDLGAQQPANGLIGLHDARARFIDLIEDMFALGKPIIARVDGACMGGGLGLMLACDLAIASEGATFGTPEIKVGLFPMMIMTLIFRNVPRKRATEMMLTGQTLQAQEAASIGLINRALPADQLDEATRDLALHIASFSPAVLKLGRDAIYQTMDMDIHQGLQHLRSQLTLNTLLDDAAEGVTAFISRRPPQWKGR